MLTAFEQPIGDTAAEADVLEALVGAELVEPAAGRVGRVNPEVRAHVVLVRPGRADRRIDAPALSQTSTVDAPDGRQKSVVVGDVLPGLQLKSQIPLWIRQEVISAHRSKHHRRVDFLEVVDLIVLDVVALLDELPGHAQPPVIARKEVRPQPRADHLHEGLRVVEIAGAQVPQRDELVVVRPFVIGRRAGASAEGEVHPGARAWVDRVD